MTKEAKKELLNDEESLDIKSTLYLEAIQLKSFRWTAKIVIKTILPRSYRAYKVQLDFDEEPYVERIKELEDEFSRTLFREEKASKKQHDDRIKELRQELQNKRDETERIKFTTMVDELKYKNAETLLIMSLPDDVIESFNRQKTRLDIYKITLTPIL